MRLAGRGKSAYVYIHTYVTKLYGIMALSGGTYWIRGRQLSAE